MTIRRSPPVKPVAASVSSRRRAAKKIEALRQREIDLLVAIDTDRGLMRSMGDKIRTLGHAAVSC